MIKAVEVGIPPISCKNKLPCKCPKASTFLIVHLNFVAVLKRLILVSLLDVHEQQGLFTLQQEVE